MATESQIVAPDGSVVDGKTLSPGECYSPDHPLILGGELDDDNLQPCDICVHASIQRQIHKQIKDLSPGTKISDIQLG